MKKITLLLLFFATPLVAQITSPSVRYVVTPPSGACAQSPPIEIVISTLATWGCQSGTWAQITSGGGGGAPGGANTNVQFNNSAAFGGDATFTFNATTKALSAQKINGVSYSADYTSTDLATRINACLSDALNKANGNTTKICNASAEGGSQSILSEIDVGDSTGDNVTLILPCAAQWVGTVTGGSIIKQYGGTTVKSDCPASGPANSMIIQPSNVSTHQYIYQTAPSTNAPYTYMQGFNIFAPPAAHTASSGIGFYFNGPLADATAISSVNVYDEVDAKAAEAYNLCCSVTWELSSINAGYVGTPLTVLSDNNSTLPIQQFQFINGSIVHPGSGLHAVVCQDTTTNHNDSVFKTDNVYTEGSNSDTTTAFYLDNGCSSFTATNAGLFSNVSGSTAPGFLIEGTAGFAGITHPVMRPSTGNFTYPATAISDQTFTPTRTLLTDSLGNFDHYSTASVPTQMAASTTLGDIPYGGTAGVAEILPGNTSPTDAVLVSHASGAATPVPSTATCTAFGTPTETCTWSSALAAGSFVVVGVSTNGGGSPGATTVTDSASNTYTAVAGIHQGTSLTTTYTQLFYFGPLTSSITTVTAHATNSVSLVVDANATTNIASTSPLDGSICYADTSATTAISCGTAITTTAANDYIFCDAHNATASDNFSVGSGFTAGSSYNGNHFAQYKVQTAIGATTPAIVSALASPATMSCAAFKASSTAAAPMLTNSPAINTANTFAGGTTFSVTGCGTATSLVGGSLAGRFNAAATSCAPVITTNVTAPNGYDCNAADLTTPADLLKQASSTTTTATFGTATVVSGDTISFSCRAY